MDRNSHPATCVHEPVTPVELHGGSLRCPLSCQRSCCPSHSEQQHYGSGNGSKQSESHPGRAKINGCVAPCEPAGVRPGTLCECNTDSAQKPEYKGQPQHQSD